MRRSVGFVLGIVVGAVVGAAGVAVAGSDDILYRKLELLAQVLAHIENHYVDGTSATEIVHGAARGAAGVLDEHSAFFTPDEYRQLLDATEGEYAGIGIELGWEEELQLPGVIAVLEGSAAHRAGMKRGDVIVSVDGQDIAGQSLEVVQTRLRGPVGSKVVLGVQRVGREPWSFTLVRAWVRLAPVEHTTTRSGLTYAHVKTFSRRVAADLETSLARERGTRGLILDLRGNPGGLFDEAVAMCDLFLRDGPIVSVVGRGGRVLERHEAKKRGSEPTYPIAVLIDGGSASAAEVVAGCLGDRGRGRLFGTTSYGKGSVQSILDLAGGAGLKLTVARYYTPSGRVIDGQGITPDERILAGGDDDEVLEAAEEWLLSQKR